MWGIRVSRGERVNASVLARDGLQIADIGRQSGPRARKPEVVPLLVSNSSNQFGPWRCGDVVYDTDAGQHAASTGRARVNRVFKRAA
jgi:hypothetical protein